jgi:hypothetical protein
MGYEIGEKMDHGFQLWNQQVEQVRNLAEKAKTTLLPRCEYLPFQNLFAGREYFTRFSWPLIDQIYVASLKKYIGKRKVLEIASGVGYLAKWMQEAGVQWIPTDLNASDPNWWKHQIPFVPILQLTAQAAIEEYLDQVDLVFFSWIPLNSRIDREVLGACHALRKPVLILGESEGCTGSYPSDRGFEVFHPFKKERDVVQWAGIHDATEVWIPTEEPHQLYGCRHIGK